MAGLQSLFGLESVAAKALLEAAGGDVGYAVELFLDSVPPPAPAAAPPPAPAAPLEEHSPSRPSTRRDQDTRRGTAALHSDGEMFPLAHGGGTSGGTSGSGRVDKRHARLASFMPRVQLNAMVERKVEKNGRGAGHRVNGRDAGARGKDVAAADEVDEEEVLLKSVPELNSQHSHGRVYGGSTRNDEELATRGALPHGWVECTYSLGWSRKLSPGVAAFAPGATLVLEVPGAEADPTGGKEGISAPPETATSSTPLAQTAPSAAAPPSATRTRAMQHVELNYLTSYHGMGVVELSCHGGCRCVPFMVDAHRPTTAASVFEQTSVNVTRDDALGSAAPACELQLEVLNQTSSGGHKWKLRDVRVYDGIKLQGRRQQMTRLLGMTQIS
jgi:hypothetical protein